MSDMIDRKSTRLNSSHVRISYAVFCLKKKNDSRPLIKSMKATKPRSATAQWGLFLRNHDELDLGRLTKAQRETVFKAFGPDKGMQLYDRGIRRRLAPMLGGDRRRFELSYSLMFSFSCTAVHRDLHSFPTRRSSD